MACVERRVGLTTKPFFFALLLFILTSLFVNCAPFESSLKISNLSRVQMTPDGAYIMSLNEPLVVGGSVYAGAFDALEVTQENGKTAVYMKGWFCRVNDSTNAFKTARTSIGYRVRSYLSYSSRSIAPNDFLPSSSVVNGICGVEGNHNFRIKFYSEAALQTGAGHLVSLQFRTHDDEGKSTGYVSLPYSQSPLSLYNLPDLQINELYGEFAGFENGQLKAWYCINAPHHMELQTYLMYGSNSVENIEFEPRSETSKSVNECGSGAFVYETNENSLSGSFIDRRAGQSVTGIKIQDGRGDYYIFSLTGGASDYQVPELEVGRPNMDILSFTLDQIKLWACHPNVDMSPRVVIFKQSSGESPPPAVLDPEASGQSMSALKSNNGLSQVNLSRTYLGSISGIPESAKTECGKTNIGFSLSNILDNSSININPEDEGKKIYIYIQKDRGNTSSPMYMIHSHSAALTIPANAPEPDPTCDGFELDTKRWFVISTHTALDCVDGVNESVTYNRQQERICRRSSSHPNRAYWSSTGQYRNSLDTSEFEVCSSDPDPNENPEGVCTPGQKQMCSTGIIPHALGYATCDSNQQWGQCEFERCHMGYALVDGVCRSIPSAVNTFINNLYNGVLGRAPELKGKQDWSTAIMSNPTLAQCKSIVNYFYISEEYSNRSGIGNREFVESLYTAYFGRNGDSGGVDYWTGQLDSNAKTRDELRHQAFAPHNETTSNCENVIDSIQ